MDKRNAVALFWSRGRRAQARVTVFRETPKRYRVRLEEPLPWNQACNVGTFRLVPKHAVTFTDLAERSKGGSR